MLVCARTKFIASPRSTNKPSTRWTLKAICGPRFTSKAKRSGQWTSARTTFTKDEVRLPLLTSDLWLLSSETWLLVPLSGMIQSCGGQKVGSFKAPEGWRRSEEHTSEL